MNMKKLILLAPVLLTLLIGLPRLYGNDKASDTGFKGDIFFSVGMGSEFKFSKNRGNFYSEASLMYCFSDRWLFRAASSPIYYYQRTDSFCNFLGAGYRLGKFVFHADIGAIVGLPLPHNAGLAIEAGVFYLVGLSDTVFFAPQFNCVKSLLYGTDVLNLSLSLNLQYRLDFG